jgi:protein involved in polysaccharide export with SLBB domain
MMHGPLPLILALLAPITLLGVEDTAPAPAPAVTGAPIPGPVAVPAAPLAASPASTPAKNSEKEEKKVSWRDRYTLGPGDILNFGLYGRPDLERNELFVQPDGTISYLQVQNIKASGLTIDELRAAIEARLSQYYKQARLIISPVELRSKKYYILGKVVDNGAFNMDRPTTILEAVARSRGIETGLFEQNTVELADLERSFMVRNGKRMKVDFQKLFFEGDMKQNLEIEPGDYLYFPSANTNEVYVLGEVTAPGIQGFTPRLTVVAAISRRQGFTKDAYREKVLVVRGSLQKPELIVVNTDAILKGREPDFLLKPKDIVYVNPHPWKFAEELTEAAVSAFLQSAVTTYTGQKIIPSSQ